MTVVNGYITREKLKTAVRDNTTGYVDEYDRAIGAASRVIDKWAGRFFWREPTAVARLFRADDITSVCCGDFPDPGDVVVETDDNADGTWTVWDDAAWQAEPFVTYNDEPYTQITTTTRLREFPLEARRARVRVTTRWGWSEIPYPVEQACQVLATFIFRGKDQVGMDIGLDRREAEPVSVDPVSVAMKLVKPYAVKGGSLYEPPAGMGCC